MKQLSGHGLGVELPEGWDGRIYTRTDETSDRANRSLHAATFALPADPGDFAAAAVGHMSDADVLVVLLEYDREVAGSALFAHEGLPTTLAPERFGPNAMPRAVPGRTASQFFFSLDGRAFCLFVVLGSHRDRVRLAALAASVVASIRVGQG